MGTGTHAKVRAGSPSLMSPAGLSCTWARTSSTALLPGRRRGRSSRRAGPPSYRLRAYCLRQPNKKNMMARGGHVSTGSRSAHTWLHLHRQACTNTLASFGSTPKNKYKFRWRQQAIRSFAGLPHSQAVIRPSISSLHACSEHTSALYTHAKKMSLARHT